LAKELKWENAYKRGSRYSDSARLAEEIQEQVEAFAARHGVYPDLDKDGAVVMRSPAGHIILYHGTTQDRARAIMEEGFRTKEKHVRSIWFTRRANQARGIARRRAEQRGKEPAVLCCEINLDKYANFKRPRSDHYAFRYSHIDKDVIHSVTSANDGPPNLIRLFIKEAKGILPQGILPQSYGNVVNLWYGAAENRARAIMKEGFKQEKRGEGILFTRKSREARSMAKSESRSCCGEKPVIFRCEIDLEEYPMFERPKPNHYAFRYPHIARNVILSISGLAKDKADNQLIEQEEKGELVDVVITKISGKLGVLYWINRYLELKGKEAISEDHLAVEAIFKWVEEEYAAGREEPISNEEMLRQVMTHLKQEVQIGEKA